MVRGILDKLHLKAEVNKKKASLLYLGKTMLKVINLVIHSEPSSNDALEPNE